MFTFAIHEIYYIYIKYYVFVKNACMFNKYFVPHTAHTVIDIFQLSIYFNNLRNIVLRKKFIFTFILINFS